MATIIHRSRILPTCKICSTVMHCLSDRSKDDAGICALVCGHMFHYQCFATKYISDRRCPTCQESVTRHDIIPGLYFGPETEFDFERPQQQAPTQWELLIRRLRNPTPQLKQKFVIFVAMFAIVATVICLTLIFFVILTHKQATFLPKEIETLKFGYFHFGLFAGLLIPLACYVAFEVVKVEGKIQYFVNVLLLLGFLRFFYTFLTMIV